MAEETFPSTESFMVAIQEIGIADKKSEKKDTKVLYPIIRKLACSIYSAIVGSAEYHSVQWQSNASRTYDIIEGLLLVGRKKVDTARVRPELRSILELNLGEGESLPSMMYYFTNEADGGLQVLKNTLKDKFVKSTNKQAINRTPNDALRVAGILLLPKNRSSFSGTSKRNNRVQSDQPVSTTIAFSESTQNDFSDATLEITHPLKLRLLKGFDKFDPNDTARMSIPGRDSTWVWATWKDYIKPKYAKALMNWSKKTGNGSGQSESFQAYCNSFTWLGWIYLKDEEAGFLLSSISDHNVPRRLSNEAGFRKENISDDDDNDEKPRSKKMTKAGNASARVLQKTTLQLSKAREESKEFLMNIKESIAAVQKRMVQDDTPISKHMKRMKVLDDRYEEYDIRYGGFVSSESKAMLLKGIDSERAQVMNQIVQLQSSRLHSFANTIDTTSPDNEGLPNFANTIDTPPYEEGFSEATNCETFILLDESTNDSSI